VFDKQRSGFARFMSLTAAQKTWWLHLPVDQKVISSWWRPWRKATKAKHAPVL